MTYPPAQRSFNYIGRGVKSTAIMTNKEKVKIVSSVYSNVKKLTIAQLLKEKSRSGEQIAEITGYTRPTISGILKEMESCGVVAPTQKSWFTYYSLTKLGRRLLLL